MSHRGVTLLELLITIIIGSIAMLALAIPFGAERRFWVTGKAQTEAQRDAQLVLRAIARGVRESTGYAGGGSFNVVCGPGPDGRYGTADDVTGTRQFVQSGAQLQMSDSCVSQTVTLIDGVLTPSQVTSFSIASIPGTTKLVQVQLNVARGQQNESLVTQMFLRTAL